MPPTAGPMGRHVLVYAAGAAIGKLAGFIMLPVYTRFLTPSEYGVLELLSMTIDLIGLLTGMTLAMGVFKFYSRYEDPREQRDVIRTSALGIIGLAIPTALLGFLAAPDLTRLVLGPSGDPLYFRLFFAIYLLQAGEAVPLLYLRALHRSGTFILLNLAKLLAMLSLNVFLLVFMRMGVLAVLLSNLIVTGMSMAALLTFLFRSTGFGFSPAKFREIAKYAYPLAFVSLGNFFLVFSDRYFLNYYASTSAVGIYSLAYRFAFILSAFAVQPFMLVWGPQRFEIAKRPDARRVYSRVFLYLNLALGTMAFLIALFVHDLLRLMAEPAFLPAYRIVPLVLAAQILQHWTGFSNLGMLLKDRTGMFAWTSSAGIVAVLALNFLLIPRYGIWGAAYATVGAYLLRFLLVHALSQRYYGVPYPWAPIARLYLVYGAALVAQRLIGPLPFAASVGASLGVAVAGILVVYFQVLPLEDQRRGSAALRRWRTRRVFATSGG